MKETIIAVSWQSVAPRGRYWYYKMSVVVSVVCLPPDCQLVEPGAWCIILTFWSGVIVIISHHHHNNIISSTLTRNYEPRIIRNNLLINSRPDSQTPDCPSPVPTISLTSVSQWKTIKECWPCSDWTVAVAGIIRYNVSRGSACYIIINTYSLQPSNPTNLLTAPGLISS